MKQKHIVVVDGMWIGHHPTYVKTFAKILLGAGYRVSVLCPAPEEVSSWVQQDSPPGKGRFSAHYYTDPEPGLLRCIPGKIRYVLSSLARWIHVSRSLKTFVSSAEKPDLVFFAWLDSYLYGYLPTRLIDRIFPFAWSGLYFHPRHFRDLKSDGMPRNGYFSPPVNFIARSKRAASIAVLDAGIVDALRSKLPGKQAAVLPDFSDEVPASDHCHLAEEIRTKAKARKIIGLLGALARRKGLLTLIRIVKQSAAKDRYFVFAGELLEETFSKDELDEVRAFFNAHREDCYIHAGKIPDDAQFNALVNVCDVIFAMYEDFPHSSNLITKSALYGKSVLVSSGGYMEEVVRRYQLGEVVPAGDIQAALAALLRLTTSEHSHENVAGMREYAMKQSQEKLRQILLELVEDSMNCHTGKKDIACQAS